LVLAPAMSETPASAFDLLNRRQQAFVRAYLSEARWNATRAARIAGYSAATAREQASRLLTNVNIAAAISELTDQAAMPAPEVLARLADQARGTLEDFIDDEGRVDIKQAREAGKLHLVKEYAVEQERRGGDDEWWEVQKIKLKLYDAQAALVQLGRHHSLFTDKIEASGPGGGPLRLEWNDGPTDTDEAPESAS